MLQLQTLIPDQHLLFLFCFVSDCRTVSFNGCIAYVQHVAVNKLHTLSEKKLKAPVDGIFHTEMVLL